MKARIRNRRSAFFLSCSTLPALFVMLALPVANAQSADGEHFSLSLGVFLTDRDTRTTLDGSSGNPGTDVDLEKDLGLSRSDSVFRIDGYYKFHEKHRIDFSWFDLSRTSSKQIERDIEWNGTLFPVSTSVNSEFDLGIYKLAYTWSFYQQEKNFLGATAGLYIADTGTSLSAPNIAAREVASVTAPLPVVGLRGQHYFSGKWSVRASAELFLFEYNDWDGDLMDLYVGLDYQFSDRIAFGAGFNAVTFDLGVTKENFTGNLDWGYSGGMVFVRASF